MDLSVRSDAADAGRRATAARDAILLVGMGRSGTSALARVLSLCGGALPLDLLPPNAGNPTGYWEPGAAFAFDEIFLAEHGSSWYDTSLALQHATLADADRRAFVGRIVDFLQRGVEPGGPMVIKEPRITALLPYWLGAAAKANVRVTMVQPLRAPADVTASLAARDGLPAETALALWLKYNLLADRGARAAGVPRLVVRYDDLLAAWEPVVERCIAALGVPLEIGEQARRDVAAFLSPEMQHHRAATIDAAGIDPVLLGWVGELYGAMRASADGTPPPELVDALYDAYARWRPGQ